MHCTTLGWGEARCHLPWGVGESWEARAAERWLQHGLSLAVQLAPQQAPVGTAVPTSTAAARGAAATAGGELGVRVDRRQFAAARGGGPPAPSRQLTASSAAPALAARMRVIEVRLL